MYTHSHVNPVNFNKLTSAVRFKLGSKIDVRSLSPIEERETAAEFPNNPGRTGRTKPKILNESMRHFSNRSVHSLCPSSLSKTR
jgi:hypothetical protein